MHWYAVPVNLLGHLQQRTQFPGDAKPLTQEPIALMLGERESYTARILYGYQYLARLNINWYTHLKEI